MARVGAVGLLMIAAACSSPIPSSSTPASDSNGAEPFVVADALNDVVPEPIERNPIDGYPWIDIQRLTVSRTAVELRVSLELGDRPNPTKNMTYSIEIDTSGDGVSDYSLWAEYFGDGVPRPGLVPWNEEPALFDEEFPGGLTATDDVLTWIVPLAVIHGDSLRVAATAQAADDGEDARMVALDWVPDTQVSQQTREEDYSWIVVPPAE